MKRIYLLLFIFFIFISCKGQKDFLNPFQERIEPRKGLFNLLDDYPALKSLFSNVDPDAFNYKLAESLSFYPEAGVESLRSLENLTLNENAKLREVLLELSHIMQRVRTYDSASYEQVTDIIQRIRNHPDPFLENIIPLTHNGLKKIYLENTKSQLSSDVLDIVSILKEPDTQQNLKDIEDLLHKTLYLNSNAREGSEKVLQSLLIFSSSDTSALRKKITNLMLQLGDTLGNKVGYSQKPASRVIKELIVNLESYATAGSGTETNIYDTESPYSNTSYGGYSSKLDDLFIELFKKIRNLILPDPSMVKDTSRDILEMTMKNLNSLGFSVKGVDSSLIKLIQNDFLGRNRVSDANTQYSGRFSALETLAYLVALTKHFGYNWNMSCPSSTSKVYITGESGGYLSLGDSINALRSKNDCTDLGTANIMNQSNNLGETYKNGSIFKYTLSTPALCLLEGNSKGDIDCNDYNNDSFIDPDPVYAKTLPWVFGWINRILFEGYGPFYVSGETPTSFQDTWTTSEYKIKVRNNDFAGLGGIQNPAGNGSYYTIKEIGINDRETSSKEEAFYKNLLWLMYYKRFVIVIPLQANIGAGVLGGNAVKDAVYITIIANGLKGLMNAKPYCTSSSSQCNKDDNGKWILSGQRIKTYNQQGDLDANSFSDIPGDSVILVEVWGCDILNPCNYGFSGDNPAAGEILYSTVYNSVLFPYNAGDFSGAIPPAISKLFGVMEQLAFISDEQVSFDSISAHWEKRNRITPLLTALVKALKEQSQSINDGDSSNDYNAFNLMIDILIPLVKTYMFVGNDPYEFSKSGENVSITLFRILGYRADNNVNVRNPELQSELYYPDAEYIVNNQRFGIRSIVSILSENQGRYYDGLLPLLASSSLLDELVGLLQEFGSENYTTNRQNLAEGIKKIFGEIKITSESPSTHQYNIQTTLTDLAQKIADYPDTRSTNLESSDWEDINDIIDLGWKLLSSGSEYSISTKLEYLIKIIADINISESEIASMLNLLVGILVDDNNNPAYRITNLTTGYLTDLLNSNALYTRSLVGIMAGISKPNSFGDYFMTTMKSSYHARDILYNLEKLLASNQIQSREPSEDNILYQVGSLTKVLAEIKEQGRKTGVVGYTFEDKWNINELPDTYFDLISLMLTK